MKLIIRENQRGFLFKNGKFMELLGPGKYFVLRKMQGAEAYGAPCGKLVEVVSCNGSLTSRYADGKTLLKNPAVAAAVTVLKVERGELGFRFCSGTLAGIYEAGEYAFWDIHGDTSFRKADITTPFVPDDFPRDLFNSIRSSLYTEAVVEERNVGLLFLDGKFEKILPAGKYYFWYGAKEVSVRTLPACVTQENIVGQEILTADKVSLRINCVCSYRFTDPVRAVTEVGDAVEQLHVAVQLALREFIGKLTLDEILSDKSGVSESLFQRLGERAPELFLEVREVAVKDVILPGEIREIMNTVLVAEKRAQASLIARREEVASTRSLLNTAKLMEENQTLYKLKEMEYLERIFENVTNLSLGGGEILSQLRSLLGEGRNGT